jgi:radical SAM superfamily enzyme YgiQ (UPF0313 family)
MLGRIKCKFKKGPVVLVSKEIAYTFPLSYAYLAGYLKMQGEVVHVLFRPNNPSYFNLLVKQIMELNPVLVGFGSLYPELKDIAKIIKMLNDANREFPVVIGGQMVSPIPEFAVKVTGADFGVIGEGEIVLHQLVTTLREGKEPSNVKGLAIRQDNEVILTGVGEIIEDLTLLSPIPYEFFPKEKWLSIGRWYTANYPQPHWRFRDRVINVHGGRGCPFSCNFCYHHSKPRYRPVAQMIAEAAEALDRFDGNMLYFSDETALPSSARVRQVINEIRTLKKRIEYSVSSRFDILDRIDDNLLYEMKETGCRIMGLGIESGSDRILKIIGKKFTSEIVRRGLERLRKVGILPTVSIMVGQYTETMEDVEASIELMKESVHRNSNIQYAFTITTPFPGSQLYNFIFEKGYLKEHKEFYDRYFYGIFKHSSEWNFVVNLSRMTDKELFLMYNRIKQEYMKEKIKNLNPIVATVDFSRFFLGKVNQKLVDKIISKFHRNKLFKIFLKIYNSIYDFIQIELEKLSLILRGVR